MMNEQTFKRMDASGRNAQLRLALAVAQSVCPASMHYDLRRAALNAEGASADSQWEIVKQFQSLQYRLDGKSVEVKLINGVVVEGVVVRGSGNVLSDCNCDCDC